MKKLSFLIPILLAPFIVSCDNVEKDNSLIFTEFCVGVASANRAVEVTNISENTIDLSNYSICIYRSFSGIDSPTDVIQLSGTLESMKQYVVSYNECSGEFRSKANLLSENLLNLGQFSMAIKYKGKFNVDAIGTVGFSSDLAQNSDLVRKKEYLIPRGSQYNAYDWIRYPLDNTTHLGNLDCISENDLLNGPKLTQNDFNTPYCSSTLGDGGAMKVPLVSTIDGDTTKFNFGYTYSSYGVSGVNSIRYYGINTPEVIHGDMTEADPYGNEARDFTNSQLNSAKSYAVQSIKNYSLTETYGRMLGYVWVSPLTNPTPDSYINLSHLIVLNGFARVGFVSRTDSYYNSMLYKGVSYIEYLYDAQNFAKLNKLNIHSDL